MTALVVGSLIIVSAGAVLNVSIVYDQVHLFCFRPHMLLDRDMHLISYLRNHHEAVSLLDEPLLSSDILSSTYKRTYSWT